MLSGLVILFLVMDAGMKIAVLPIVTERSLVRWHRRGSRELLRLDPA